MAKSNGSSPAFGKGVREFVKVDRLVRDENINPGLVDERRAEYYAANFDPDLFGEIVVSERDDGSLVLIDGQNRAAALALMNWDGQQVPALVFRSITPADEARIFLGLANDRTHKHYDKFRARLTAGESTAAAIERIVAGGGYTIDRAARDGVIAATQTLEDIYLGRGLKLRGPNPKALNNVILTVTAAWGRTTHAVNGQVLKGIGMFFLRYGDVNRERLVTKLAQIVGGPKGLIAKGRGKRELHGGSLATNIAHFLTDEYNTGARGKTRLPGWRERD